MNEFEVIVHGPNGYIEFGRYRTSLINDAIDASERLIKNLADDGYIRLYNGSDGCTVVYKEYVMSFSVKPVEEEKK